MNKKKKVHLILDFLIWYRNNYDSVKKPTLYLGSIVEKYLKETLKNKRNE